VVTENEKVLNAPVLIKFPWPYAPGLLAPDGLDASSEVAATTAATHPNIGLTAHFRLMLFLPHPSAHEDVATQHSRCPTVSK
jgi:hypothetical protein